MSDFMERARAEAERRTRSPGIPGQTVPSMEQIEERDDLRRGFEAGAEWAREVLLINEPCENFTSGTCLDDSSRSMAAKYGADRYCLPCRLRYLRGGDDE